MLREQQRRLHALWCCTAILCLMGCSSDANHSDGAAEGHLEHDHDHGMPDDKPATFAEAVHQLPRRHRRVAAEFRAGHAAHAAEQIHELRELIGWLPELAADTNLKQADWDAVQQLSQRMEGLVRTWGLAATSPSDRELTEFVHFVDQLRPLSAKTLSASHHLAVAIGNDE